MMRRWLAPLLAILVMAASAGPALALLLWTLTVTPGTARAGTETTFTLTATNLDAETELGCLEVDLPISFTLLGASAGNASNGDEWEAVLFPQKVAVHSQSGGGRLELGQSITFTILARPTIPGTYSWANHAHRDQDCGGEEEIGVPLALLILPGNQSTPSPVPTPAPTPIPTPAPTPTPTPTLPIGPLPTLPPIGPLPSIPALPTLRPASPTPTIPPGSGVPSPTPSPSPQATAAPGGVVAGAPPTGTTGTPSDSSVDATGGAPVLVIGEPGGSGGPAPEVALGPLGVIDGITVWAIPGAIVGGPGLLVILWVLIQTGVAVAWIPAVRRMRGKDGGGSAWPSGQAA